MRKRVLLWIAILMTAISCGQHNDNRPAPAHRGVYHWKTTYDPTAWELQWMNEHQIDRLYIKLFDVKPGATEGFPDWAMVPVATTQFNQPLPTGMEVIPVVYITLDAIRALNTDTRTYAELIVKRIDDILSENYSGTLREVQLDCDWTERTRDAYFRLAYEVGKLLRPRNITLSGTVRLHQLRELEHASQVTNKSEASATPFDRVLLMCYNTGRLQDTKTQNSILDFADVKPYLRQYPSATLSNTDVAYPVYGWGVEFSEKGTFLRLINAHDLPETLKTQKEHHVKIREEWARPRDIIRTQQALPTLDTLHTTILYHLDSSNLSKYSHEDIEAFYSR